ncbi:MAG: IclR family transcriptional regulator [Deltaproteobacteria bacterium]|nr:IclR family transcriptional regulator [Deltaproteobacteria bacterium]
MLSRKPRGMSLSQLSEELQYPKSTVHHILSTLLPYEYVSQDPETKRYSLGFKFLSIGRVILDTIDVLELHEQCKEAVHLAILRDGKVIYIDKIDTQGMVSLATYIGYRTDPHAASGGKVLLSELSRKEIMDIYRDRPLKTYGKNTITSLPRLFEELEKIKKQGYAIDDEEYYEGIRCVAAPIRAGWKVVAAVSITGAIFTMTMERIRNELKTMVMETAERISNELQW